MTHRCLKYVFGTYLLLNAPSPHFYCLHSPYFSICILHCMHSQVFTKQKGVCGGVNHAELKFELTARKRMLTHRSNEIQGYTFQWLKGQSSI
jgi:hypothetical protein